MKKVVTSVMMIMLITTISGTVMLESAQAQSRPNFDQTVQIFDQACPTNCDALALQRVFDLDPFCLNVFFDGICDDELASFTAQCLAQASTSFCPVGGKFLPIDSTALLVAGAQTNAVWIFSAIAVIGSVTFGALYLTSRRN